MCAKYEKAPIYCINIILIIATSKGMYIATHVNCWSFLLLALAGKRIKTVLKQTFVSRNGLRVGKEQGTQK